MENLITYKITTKCARFASIMNYAARCGYQVVWNEADRTYLTTDKVIAKKFRSLGAPVEPAP